MDDFLARRHDAYTTRPDEIAAVVGKVTRQPIAGYEKLVRGYDNEVYVVTLHDGSRFVVRIRRHGELPMEDEAWAIEQARAAGAPVPVVYLCEHFLIDGAERPVMVQAFVPGHPLGELAPTLTPDEVRACVVQAARALANVHSVRVEGWYMRRHGVWDFVDGAAIAASNLEDRRSERVAALAAGITVREWDRLITALDTLQQCFPPEVPVLLHGDYTPDHLLFDDALRLAGIIDWGQSQGGTPMVDLLGLRNAGLGVPVDMEWLRAGYGAAPIWDTFAERILAHEIGFTIGSLNHHYVIGDVVAVMRYADRLHRLAAEVQRLGLSG